MASTAHGPSSEGHAAEGSLLDAVRGILRDLPGLFSDRIELLSLELQRAGQALLQIVVLGVALAVLALTTWLILWSLIITGLTMAGLHWMLAFVGALAMHGLLGLWLVHLLKKLLPMLRLPATRRRLMFTSSPVPAASAASPSSAGVDPLARAHHAPVTAAQDTPPTQAQG